MEIIKADKQNIKEVAILEQKLWNNHKLSELYSEVRDDLESGASAFFLAKDNEKYIGFAHISLRNDYVEGTLDSPVGYLEGIFVEDNYRKLGIAKKLIKCGEEWAKEKGCKEIASDCELNNTISESFHLKCGFTEANKIICFTKKI